MNSNLISEQQRVKSAMTHGRGGVPEGAAPPLPEIPCTVGGRPAFNPRDTILSEDYLGRPLYRIHRAGPWTIEAALEVAARTQPKLATIAPATIAAVLARAMEYYFASQDEIDAVVSLTGTSRQFVRESFCQMKGWCGDLDTFLNRTLRRRGLDGWLFQPTAPVVAVLPGNSEAESLYVFAQVLLSRNAAIIRPSSKGAGAYVAGKFIEAYSAALKEMYAGEDSEEYAALRSAFSVLHTSTSGYLEQIAVGGWNYVVFGNDATMRRVDDVFESLGIRPRAVVRYGTGFSATLVLQDADLDRVIEEIAESVSINCGNECNSTDIVYVADSRAEEFAERLSAALSLSTFGDPHGPNSNGFVSAGNQRYIEEQLHLRGRERCEVHHPDAPTCVLRLHAYESAMEYPGPVVSVRGFASLRELADLMEKDLRDNSMQRNLACSVYTPSRAHFLEVVPLLRAYTVRHNRPTHAFDPYEPHQGLFLVEELTEFAYCRE